MFERRESAVAESLACKLGKLGDRGLGDRLEPAGPGREHDAERAPVIRVAFAPHESLALEQAHHRGHRLLAQASAAGQLAHPQPVLLVQRHQQGAIARSHVAPTGGAKPLLQKLVPTLGGLGKEEAKIISIHN